MNSRAVGIAPTISAPTCCITSSICCGLLQAILTASSHNWNIFLYQGPNGQVNARVATSPRLRDRGHKSGIFVEKGLDFARHRPKLKLPPRPGPGSSGHPVLGNPSTPKAGCPPLILGAFWLKMRLRREVGRLPAAARP